MGSKVESEPVRVDIRVAGRMVFAQDCYDHALVMENDTVKFTAAVHPTLVNVEEPRHPEEFRSARKEFEEDPRAGETVIQQVHSGSRKGKQPPASERVAAPQPRETK
jgi:hypothetical protein